ncbi:MAG: hypothetical protein ACE14M_11565 [Terriglobales bacterium]
MQLDRDLEKIANLRFDKEVQQINDDSEQERRETVNKLAARGIANGGAMYRAMMELAVKRANRACKALVDIWTDLLARKYGNLTSEHVDFICGKADQILAASKHIYLPSGCLQQAPQAAIQGELSRRISCIASGIRRDLEIIRREQATLPPVRKERSEVTNIYHLHGHNSRVNIHSTDISVNNVNLADTEIFSTLREAVSSGIADLGEQKLILEKLAALEAANGKPSFVQRYSEFISAAADHMTLIYPFVPALTEMMQKTLGG